MGAEGAEVAEMDRSPWFDGFPAEKTMVAEVTEVDINPSVGLKERVLLHCPKARVKIYFRHTDWKCDCNLGPAWVDDFPAEKVMECRRNLNGVEPIDLKYLEQ